MILEDDEPALQQSDIQEQLQGGETPAGGDTVAETHSDDKAVDEQWDIVAENVRAEPTEAPQMSQQGG